MHACVFLFDHKHGFDITSDENEQVTLFRLMLNFVGPFRWRLCVFDCGVHRECGVQFTANLYILVFRAHTGIVCSQLFLEQKPSNSISFTSMFQLNRFQEEQK